MYVITKENKTKNTGQRLFTHVHINFRFLILQFLFLLQRFTVILSSFLFFKQQQQKKKKPKKTILLSCLSNAEFLADRVKDNGRVNAFLKIDCFQDCPQYPHF